MLYPLLTNVVVFGMSVGATYLTMKGGDRGANGKLTYGKIGEFFHKRGTWVSNKFKNMGMTENQADMSKMVFFSFADGCLVAPGVKLLEDRREQIAYTIDEKLGTLPEDRSIYDAEPKQDWGSVIGGRLATCSVVVPTAVVLEKAGLNDVLFHNPGLKIGEAIVKKPNLARHFGKLDIPMLSKVALFEAFYTSVCTGGLYVCSRALATLMGKKKPETAESSGVSATLMAVPENNETMPAEAASNTRSFAPPIAAAGTTGWKKSLNMPRPASFADLAERSSTELVRA